MLWGLPSGVRMIAVAVLLSLGSQIGCSDGPTVANSNTSGFRPAGEQPKEETKKPEAIPVVAPPSTPQKQPESKPVSPVENAAQPVAGDEPKAPPPAGEVDPQPPVKDPADPADPATEPAEVEDPPAKPKESPEVGEIRLIEDADHIFPRRVSFGGNNIFPPDAEWLNTSGPIRSKDLKGKFVLLDFWTYCCINCIHVLPELKKLEQKYPNELVVIGVHSAKFDEEKDSENIAAAIQRYEIEHPVINDADHKLWNGLGVSSWPTIALLDPQGHLVAMNPGEFKAEDLTELLDEAIAFYNKKGLLDRRPVHFDLLAHRAAKTPLRFPGKVLADEAGGRLFITDSNHNRIVVTTLDGKLLETIGSGAAGKKNGNFATATFDHPQGCALVGDILYVADTENHLLRIVDLKKKMVGTIAGTGEQGRHAWPGIEEAVKSGKFPKRWVGPPSTTAINSPWALWVHKDALYIAMAGPHQIWKMPLDKSEIGPYAGSQMEDIIDGPLLPAKPPVLARFESIGPASAFAQPSGLTSDGEWLYVADSEGSSIRAVPFDTTKEVRTVVGTSELPGGRLFEFGDVDGERDMVKLQHPLEVVYHEGTIYVADTYNNKIKAVDAKTGDTKTVAGGAAGNSDEDGTFDEPTGLAYAQGKLYVADTNNHLIRMVDLASGKVGTLTIEGLAPPEVAKTDKRPDFSGGKTERGAKLELKPADGKVTLNVKIDLPAGWKINPLAPAVYYVDEVGDAKRIDAGSLGKKSLASPAAEFPVELTAAAGETVVKISMQYYYCQEDGGGLCKVGSVVFQQPVKIADDAANTSATLTHTVTE